MSFYWSYLLEMMAQLDLTFNILYKLYLQHSSISATNI